MSSAKPDLRLQKTTTPQKAATSQIARELPPAPALGSGTVPVITNKPDPKSGLGFIQPVPIKQVMPVTRLFGASTIYDAKEVTVKVAIDNQGQVTHAEALNTGRKSAGLLTWAALAAARQWTFQPATIRGVRVASEHTIVFHFAGRTH
jgi:TonB family protein